MKTLTVAAISIAMLFLPVSAYAQRAGLRQNQEQYPVKPERSKAEEKAYNDSLSRVPTKEYDPWLGIREKPPVEKSHAEKSPAPKKKPPVRPFVE